MFIAPMNVLRIQEEIKEYRRLCQQYQYSPAKEEFDDIVKFILLMSGNGTGVYESVENQNVDDYLYKKFTQDLNESLLEFQAGDQLADIANTTVDAAKGIINAGKDAAAKAGPWITYFFKKGKVKKFGEKEFQLSTKLLDQYNQIYKLKIKRAELEGNDPPKADFPGYLG
jgi:hypothetical protein